MKRVVFIAAVLGALWMLLVMWIQSYRLVFFTNPIGVLTLSFIPRTGDVAPSSWDVLLSNAWLVFTGALEFALLGAICASLGRRLKPKQLS
jgi:hypothetical protein